MVFETDFERGLTENEAELRLKKYGLNEIIEREKVTAFKILFSQFEDPIVLIFVAAAAMSAFLGEIIDFAVIGAITLFIVLLGFVQEFKAEEALEKLKELTVPIVKVLRSGKLREIHIENLVVGDIVVLASGDMVTADCKLIKANNLFVDESMLTGESKPIHKKNGEEVYRGTIVVRGNAKVEVIATGARTKFGKIAALLEERSESAIQKKSQEIASVITKLVIYACVLIAVIGLIKGASIVEIISVAIATAIAGIPEALPLTTTIVLALGVFKMVKKKAIVRRLSAVEELGMITVICTDKTGTLTKNEMTVEKIYTGGKEFTVTGKGYGVNGSILYGTKEVSDKTLEKFFVSATLCNNADLVEMGEDLKTVGDPIEIALLVASRKYGLNEDIIRNRYPRTAEEPFSSDKKYMITEHRDGKRFRIIKGASEVVFSRTNRIMIGGKEEKFTEEWKKKLESKVDEFASQGLRVIALAVSSKLNWTLLGIVGMEDPPREGVDKAVESAHKAGIKVYMVTGDNPITAASIGKKVGIEGKVVVGKDIQKLSDEKLLELLKEVRILARIDPEDKLRIVKLLKEKGEVVAMTGDGVNDAPAMKAADVGVAMGGRGTEVAKGASDIVLADDNFVTIVNAIGMGRGIYENIRKFTAFLLSWNVGVTAMILLGVAFFGMKDLILLPLQILLLNVILEDLPAIALGLDPVSEDIMNLPPRNPKEKFISKNLWTIIIGLGMYMALISMAIFIFYAVDLTLARTMAFLSFSGFVIFNAFNFRSLQNSLFKTLFKKNWTLVMAILASLIITLVAMYTSAGITVFKFAATDLIHWGVALGMAATILIVGEVLKLSVFTRKA